MSFICGVCEQQTEPGREAKMVPLQQRKVSYITPLVRKFGEGQTTIKKHSTGREPVKEVLACRACYASPPEPEIVEEKTLHQPTVFLKPKRREREEIED